MSLFEPQYKPLYEILRPSTLDDFLGQPHLTGEKGFIRAMIQNGKPFSLLMYGPPGTGKTTLARIIAQSFDAVFIYFNAVESSTVDIKKTIQTECVGGINILFVDEIHRFNKTQQALFLPYIESGKIILIATTTENPAFSVISPLLSRLRMIRFEKLDLSALSTLLVKGSEKIGTTLNGEIHDMILDFSDGDGRTALLLLEHVSALQMQFSDISIEEIRTTLSKKMLLSDKNSDFFYNYLSALHKSLRGSDADAAVYWVTVMIDSGMDPRAIVRRMIAMASEDIGLADPNAVHVALCAWQALEALGVPEATLNIIQTAIYLALAPKSNSVATSLQKARNAIAQFGTLPVPSSISSATHSYRYPHDYEDYLIPQDYLPQEITTHTLVTLNDHGKEKAFRERWEYIKAHIRNKE